MRAGQVRAPQGHRPPAPQAASHHHLSPAVHSEPRHSPFCATSWLCRAHRGTEGRPRRTPHCPGSPLPARPQRRAHTGGAGGDGAPPSGGSRRRDPQPPDGPGRHQGASPSGRDTPQRPRQGSVSRQQGSLDPSLLRQTLSRRAAPP